MNGSVAGRAGRRGGSRAAPAIAPLQARLRTRPLRPGAASRCCSRHTRAVGSASRSQSAQDTRIVAGAGMGADRLARPQAAAALGTLQRALVRRIGRRAGERRRRVGRTRCLRRCCRPPCQVAWVLLGPHLEDVAHQARYLINGQYDASKGWGADCVALSCKSRLHAANTTDEAEGDTVRQRKRLSQKEAHYNKGLGATARSIPWALSAAAAQRRRSPWPGHRSRGGSLSRRWGPESRGRRSAVVATAIFVVCKAGAAVYSCYEKACTAAGCRLCLSNAAACRLCSSQNVAHATANSQPIHKHTSARACRSSSSLSLSRASSCSPKGCSRPEDSASASHSSRDLRHQQEINVSSHYCFYSIF